MAKKMNFDHTALKMRISQQFGSVKNLAGALQITTKALDKKLNSQLDFTYCEMCRIVDLLQINCKEMDRYFFREVANA